MSSARDRQVGRSEKLSPAHSHKKRRMENRQEKGVWGVWGLGGVHDPGSEEKKDLERAP